jgi:site-specific recombinase XerD
MKYTVSELEMFLAQQYEPCTVKTYSEIIQLFITKNSRAHAFNLQDVVEDINNEKIISNTSRCGFLGAVKKYHDFLIFKGIRKVHPCKSLFITYQQNPIQFQNLFSFNELLALLDIKNIFRINEKKYRAILSFLIYQALHSNEICSLKIKHINIDTKLNTSRFQKQENQEH